MAGKNHKLGSAINGQFIIGNAAHYGKKYGISKYLLRFGRAENILIVASFIGNDSVNNSHLYDLVEHSMFIVGDYTWKLSMGSYLI